VYSTVGFVYIESLQVVKCTFVVGNIWTTNQSSVRTVYSRHSVTMLSGWWHFCCLPVTCCQWQCGGTSYRRVYLLIRTLSLINCL